MSTEFVLIAVVFVLLYLAFLFWYGGRGKPLTITEVDALLAEIKRWAGKQDSEEESPILQQFRDLTQNDDGREYLISRGTTASLKYSPVLATYSSIKLFGFFAGILSGASPFHFLQVSVLERTDSGYQYDTQVDHRISHHPLTGYRCRTKGRES